jgi:UPF0148 protein
MVKNSDEIMAEYLLKGGKMLSRECTVCRSPLFEIKGETLCVVCRDQGRTAEGKVISAPSPAEKVPSTPVVTASDLAGEIEVTVGALCRRIREEPDPNRCLALMECVRTGVETLALLHQG